jgi:hypothetical protein
VDPVFTATRCDHRENLEHWTIPMLQDGTQTQRIIEPLQETTMARGEKRGNREVKKPKQDKPKDSPVVSPFAVTPGKAGAPKQGGGKK